jgi:Protein of unknown function (DUF1580)
MTIDDASEKLITLREAANLIPPRRGGRKTNVATLYRWVSVGCRGIRLEAVQAGGNRLTSAKAINRFFERLTKAAGLESTDNTPPSTATRRRQSEQASRALESMGV